MISGNKYSNASSSVTFCLQSVNCDVDKESLWVIVLMMFPDPNNRRTLEMRPRQNGRHFPDDFFKGIFLNENVRISIKISLKFVP